MRRKFRWMFLLAVAAGVSTAGAFAFQAQTPAPQQALPASSRQAEPPVSANAPTPAQGAAPSSGANPAPAPAPATPPRNSLSLVILDPAHGGTDPGARGAAGISESDIVLSYARLLRISLEAQGMRVLLTRQANEDPTFDERSKVANAQRGDIFISLHVSSTGQPGTVRVYTLPQALLSQMEPAALRNPLIPWDRAQLRFIPQSRRLAELIQIQMAQRFRGSPDFPLEAQVRQLRTIAAPAVAIEVSSVSAPNRDAVDPVGPGLADGVARAVADFRTIYQGGGQ